MSADAETETGDNEGDEDDAATVTAGEAPGDSDEGLYVSLDPNDPDSEVPRAYAQQLDGETSSTPGAGRVGEAVMDDTVATLGSLIKSLTEVRPPPAVPDRGSIYTRRLDARRASLRARGRGAPEGDAAGQDRSTTWPILDLPLSAISGGRVDNIRLVEDEVAFRALCKSLEIDGQLQPIVVVAHPRIPGRFIWVAGERRRRAAAHLGWLTIKAIVLPAETKDEDLFFVNAVENVQRSRLSDFEIASQSRVMSARFGTSLAEYARRLGLSEARVQNLVRYLERLPPDVLEAWRAGDPFLNHHMLQKLSSMPHDEASEFWVRWRAARAAAPTGRLERARPRRSENRPTGTMLGRLWVAIKRSNAIDEAARDIALKIVDFCLGHSVGVPGLFDPRAPGPVPARRARSKPKRIDNTERESELPLPDPRGARPGPTD